jgi:hypothetical protein
MTKFTYQVDIKDRVAHITVTRLTDSATKLFQVAGHTDTGRLVSFMNSITDDLAEGYFPKLRKK